MGDTIPTPTQGEPKASAENATQGEPKTSVETPAQGEPKADALGEGGLKALNAERDARALAEKEVKELAAQLKAYKDAELTDAERATREAEEAKAELVKLRTDLARAEALAKYPVPEEYRDLVVGVDAESFEAAAKKLHELHSKAAGSPGGKEVFDHSMPNSGNVSPIKDGSYEAGAEKARQKFNKQK